MVPEIDPHKLHDMGERAHILEADRTRVQILALQLTLDKRRWVCDLT